MNRPVLAGSLVLLAVLAGCAMAYEPAQVEHADPLTRADFERVAGILRDRFGYLVVEDRESFRLQTEWVLFQRGGSPGRRRATVYQGEDAQLRVVVEVRYTRLGYDGLPEVTPTAGDQRAEEQLAGVLERALAN